MHVSKLILRTNLISKNKDFPPIKFLVKLLVCRENFQIFTVCRDSKKFEKHCSNGRGGSGDYERQPTIDGR